MKKYIIPFAILALGLTACNKAIEIPQETTADTPVFYFNLPASIGGDPSTKAVTLGESTATSTFEASDKVYVFIQRGSGVSATTAVAHNGTDASTYLTPTNITGASCTLEGALKFFIDDNDSFAPFAPAVDDVVYLCYNMSNPVEDYSYSLSMSYFDYSRQNGSKDEDIYDEFFGDIFLASQGAAGLDYAMAKMKVTGITGNGTDGYSLTMVQYEDETKSDAHFENLGSMFRQRLTFTDQNGDAIAAPTIERFTVRFEGDDCFVGYYWPFYSSGPYYEADMLSIDNPIISAEGDLYLALMFSDANKDLPLVLEATDTYGNVYSATKAAPAGGFGNGKYYYGSATLAWQKCIIPTVTGTSATPVYRCFTITEDPFDFTISGNSEGYNFELSEGHGGTITLDNLTAFKDGVFISQDFKDPNADISLVLTGTNNITADSYWGILVYGNLKLSCTGASATLTVTITYDDTGTCGISGDNYSSDGDPDVDFNKYNIATELDVSDMLAAPGFTVIRSARTDHADSSHTWTYTVTPVAP